jgi:DNA-directed RNA polymerase subunit M/transcription elongation factor TFIIS
MISVLEEVEFCPQCGTRLIVASNGSVFLRCPKCDYARKLPKGVLLKVKSDLSKPLDSGIVVLDRKTLKFKTLQTVDTICPSCADKKAETWSLTFGSDGISAITIYKCISCGHTWRENDFG